MNRPFLKNGIMYLPEIDSSTITGINKSISALSKKVSEKQDKLTAGDGVYISPEGVISSQGYAPEAKRSLKILHIDDNSCCDVLGYISRLLAEVIPNVEVTIGAVVNDGSTLPNYHSTIFPLGQTSKYYELIDGAWVKNMTNVDLSTTLQSQRWDIVVFSQRAKFSDNFDTYIPALNHCIEDIRAIVGHKCKIGWLMPASPYTNAGWAISSYDVMADLHKRLLRDSSCEFVIPCGTAIQNLRSIARYRSYGNQNGMQNGGKIVEGIGQLAEGYVYCLWIAMMMGIPYGVYGSNYTPAAGQSKFPNGGCVGVTAENIVEAQMAASYAIKQPFSVCDMGAIYYNSPALTYRFWSNDDDRTYSLEQRLGFSFSGMEKGKIIFMVDDAKSITSDLYEIFHAHNMPFSEAVPIDALRTVNNDGRLGIEVLKDIEADGGEILSHSISGADVTIASLGSLEAVDRALSLSKKVLSDAGFEVHGWISPQGQYEPAAKRLYAKYYRYGYGASDVSGQYKMVRPYLKNMGLSGAKALVDEVENNKSIQIMFGHFSDSELELFSLADLDELLTYIETKNVDVTTYRDCFYGYGNIRV